MAASHGTTPRYRQGCRCDLCREGNREEKRRWRARKAVAPVPAGVEHGRSATYDNYGCRCAPCAAGARAYREIRDERRRQGRYPKRKRPTQPGD